MTSAADPLRGLDEVGIPGRRTYLRPVEQSDAPLLRFLMNDPSVTGTLMGFNVPVSTEDQRRWTDTPRHSINGPWHFTIVERETGRAIGLTTTHTIDWVNRSAQNGTKIHPDAQRLGLAQDAGMARLAWSFFVVGLRRVSSAVLDYHQASIRTLEKVGYTYEGRRREAIYRDGRWCDVLLYGLLRAEAERLPWMEEYRRLVLPVDTTPYIRPPD